VNATRLLDFGHEPSKRLISAVIVADIALGATALFAGLRPSGVGVASL
jgi:hypothetical protein